MSESIECPAPRSAGKVVALGEAGIEKLQTSRFAIESALAGFASSPMQAGGEQWFQSFLAQLGPGESLSRPRQRIVVRSDGIGAAGRYRGAHG